MKSAAGDTVVLQTPGGKELLTILDVIYQRIPVEPFLKPPGSETSTDNLRAKSEVAAAQIERVPSRHSGRDPQ
jgi:hypothetical protein